MSVSTPPIMKILPSPPSLTRLPLSQFGRGGWGVRAYLQGSRTVPDGTTTRMKIFHPRPIANVTSPLPIWERGLGGEGLFSEECDSFSGRHRE
jgi:hypothetical protein